MDNLLVESSDPEEHLRILEEVMRRMERVGLQTNPDKAQWCQKEVRFLGYDVSPGRISLRRYVQDQCNQIPQVASRREVRRILGIMNLCRPCCRNLAEIVRPFQKAAAATPLPGRSELKSMARVAWSRILSSTLPISVARPEIELYLECD